MYQTKVITAESQVPAGYISMVDVREKYGETVAKNMSLAHKAGEVPAVKLMRTVNDRSGMVWVDVRAWEHWQQARQPKPAPEFQGTRDKNASPFDELASMSFAVQSLDVNAGLLVELLQQMQNTQLKTLACMQRLETAWAAGDKAS